MKMDVKKIGAIVAGAAILASSVAFAGLYYEGVELVNDNGEPQVTIVVGENAAAKDGVAAAMIAAAIANKAYKDVELTAEVVGEATCVETNNTATADCEIKDKTVTLEVTLPGLGDSAVEWGLLIAEKGDMDLGDRDNNNDGYDKTNDLWDEEANPFQDQDGNVPAPGAPNLGTDGVNNNEYYALRAGYDNFGPFKEKSLTSSKYSATLTASTEREFIFVEGATKWSTTENDVFFSVDDIVYQAVFGPNENGLNLCPGSDTIVNFADCGAKEGLDSARVQIYFLGEPWVITDIQVGAPATAFASDKQVNYDFPNAEIKLSKESQYGIINVGECLQFDDGTQVCLADISKNDLEGNPAIVDVYGPGKTPGEDEPDVQDQITPGTTASFEVAGKTYKVHVYQTAPGYNFAAKWAEMALIGEEITLKNGKAFLEDVAGVDSEYDVYMGFTNYLFDTDANYVTHLKSIMLVADNPDFDELYEGDKAYITDAETTSMSFKNFELLANGLTDEEMDKLEINYASDYGKEIELADGATIVDLNGVPVVEITTKDSRGFSTDYADDGTGTTTTQDGDTIIYILDAPGAGTTYANADAGDFILISKDGDKYIIDNNGGAESQVLYDIADGALYFEDDAANGLDAARYEFAYVEDIGDYANAPAYGYLGFKVDTTAGEIWAQDNDNTDDKGYYKTIDTLPADFATASGAADLAIGYGYDAGDKENPFITPRGTEVDGTGGDRTLDVPYKIREFQLLLKPTALAADKVNTQVIGPLREGDTATVGDVTIKVQSIDCEATATVSGGEGAYVADMTNVKAVIKAGDETYESYMAQKVTDIDPTKLVTVDTLAADAGTIITVGGPVVNTMTQAAGITVDELAENKVIVRVVGNKIVVAGYEADDTLEAAKQFIAALTAEAA